MERNPTESQEEYLARLKRSREALVTTIKRPVAEFAVEVELAAGRTWESDQFSAVLAELRALEATKIFRLRSQLVGLKNRLMGRAAPTEPATGSASRLDSDYDRWVAQVDQLNAFDEAFIEASIAAMTAKPMIGIALAVSAGELASARRFALDLAEQIYGCFSLTVAVVGEIDPVDLKDLKEALGQRGEVVAITGEDIAEALNWAVSLQQAEWVLALPSAESLPRHALYVLADAVANNPAAELIYSDEDFVDAQDRRRLPNFKSDWNEPLLLGTDYLGSAVLFRRSRLQSLGGFRPGFGRELLWDMCLRYTEGLCRESIVHLPFILLHRRLPVQSANGLGPAEQALQRREISGSITQGEIEGAAKVRLHPEVKPLVSIIIPTKNQAELLRSCIVSIDSVTEYPSFEYVIVDNGTDEPEALKYLGELEVRSDVTVVRSPGPFNYSTLNNLGAYHAKGEILALLNNDLEVTDPGWMSHLVAHASREEIGIVGVRLLYPDGTVQHAGVAMGLSHSRIEHALQRLDDPIAGYQNRILFDQWMSAVMGACMFVRKSVFEEVGGLDAESFPVTCNDVDFCLKTRLVGYENLYAGSVVCIHHESKSRGYDDTPTKSKASRQASAALAVRWGTGYVDPYFNPNLALWPSSFRLSFAPRVHRPWYR